MTYPSSVSRFLVSPTIAGMATLPTGGRLALCLEDAQWYKVVSGAWVRVLGSAALLSVPIPMSSISAPVKAAVDTITGLSDPAAYHEASDFASKTQIAGQTLFSWLGL